MNFGPLRIIILCCLVSLFGKEAANAQYGVVKAGIRYGAFPDGRGPIGGGNGYDAGPVSSDFIVYTTEELVAALARAKAGQVVRITGERKLVFDVGGRNRTDAPIRIPSGVVLAGDRGNNGSQGAVLSCSDTSASPFIMIDGTDARITGLRIEGPDPDQHVDVWNKAYLQILPKEGRAAARKYYYSFPLCFGVIVDGSGFEMDNCEVSGWSHAGIFVRAARGVDIHHCFIHLNQRHGLGYGITLDSGQMEVAWNIFEDNRHSIAGTGNASSEYWAHDNVELGCTLAGLHRFDMHGPVMGKDGFPIAGKKVLISNNTFLSKWLGVKIRGRPVESVTVTNNIFLNDDVKQCVYTWPGTANHAVRDNLFGAAKILKGVKAKKGK